VSHAQDDDAKGWGLCGRNPQSHFVWKPVNRLQSWRETTNTRSQDGAITNCLPLRKGNGIKKNNMKLKVNRH